MLASGFTVTTGTPVVTQVNPNTGRQNQANLPVTITGQFSNFAQGTSQVSFGAGITVGAVSVASPTSLTATISIALNAAVGSRTVTVTTGAEVAALANAFSVTAAVNQRHSSPSLPRGRSLYRAGCLPPTRLPMMAFRLGAHSPSPGTRLLRRRALRSAIKTRHLLPFRWASIRRVRTRSESPPPTRFLRFLGILRLRSLETSLLRRPCRSLRLRMAPKLRRRSI